MKIDITSVLCGSEKKINFEYSLPCDQVIPDVVFPKPIEVRGSVTDTAGCIELQLTAKLDYETECARCLSPVTGGFTTDFGRTVSTDGLGYDEDNDDYVTVKNNAVDIDTPLVEQILLEFPTKFLCKEDCKGLCPKCGKNLNEGNCSCNTKEIDPRLAPLAKLFEEN